MNKTSFSVRTGRNPNAKGLALKELKELFIRLYNLLRNEDYFTEAFGFICVDLGVVPGKTKDPSYALLVRARKSTLWPIEDNYKTYAEEDFFDVIEYLFDLVSKPVKGTPHNYGDCGMHWEVFDQHEGQKHFSTKINEILNLYAFSYVMSANGEIWEGVEQGFEPIFEAKTPTATEPVQQKIQSAVGLFRRHGASIDDRKRAVRDLADVLENMRPKLKELFSRQDESDLFNIANNFGIRHDKETQKTEYDAKIWLSWMFYYYLATIHVGLRKIEMENKTKE